MSPPGTRTGSGKRQIPEHLSRIGRNEQAHVGDDPQLVAGEGLEHLVDGLREPSRDEHHEPGEEGQDVHAEPHDAHGDAGRDDQDQAEEDGGPVQRCGRWDGEPGVVLGVLVDAERREAVGEEEQVRLQPEHHPQVDRHHRPHELGGAAHDEGGEPSEHHAHDGGDADGDDHQFQGNGQDRPEQDGPPPLLRAFGQNHEQREGRHRGEQVRIGLVRDGRRRRRGRVAVAVGHRTPAGTVPANGSGGGGCSGGGGGGGGGCGGGAAVPPSASSCSVLSSLRSSVTPPRPSSTRP